MIFRLKADCTFHAENVDDALLKIGLHLLSQGLKAGRNSPLVYGSLTVTPREERPEGDEQG
jgi:hypothetical protein